MPARLGTKLILLASLVTTIAVASSYLALSVEVRRQARRHLSDLLRENQTTVGNLQARSTDELLWTSRLMTLSPTLRAAMETYRAESGARSAARADLLATVQQEVDRIRGSLERELVLITDEEGRLLASSPAGVAATLEEELSGLPAVRRALETESERPEANVSLLRAGEELFQVGGVPIEMGGYRIGVLVLGERLDAGFLKRLSESLRCDVVLLLGEQVLGSTLPEADAPALRQAGEPAGTVRFGGEDYVSAALPLGTDSAGRKATVVLLHSLSARLKPVGRSLALALLGCGILAAVLAGAAAWGVSRSVLGPLERFVAFLRLAANDKNHGRRFEGPLHSAEVSTLNDAYVHLMEALHQREQEELNRVERLKETEKLASLGRMLSGAAHEINNPLTGVVGHLDLLLRDEGMEARTRRRLETVQAEARRISGLVRNLLKAAHRDTGERGVVDLNALLRDTARLREHDYTRHGMSLRLELGGQPLPIVANDLEIQQVFLNIINNAFDALQEHHPVEPGRLVVAARREGTQAVVTLSDNGPGLSDPARIFEPFYTTKAVGKGTGLGLSITQAGVAGHGGTIAAHNNPGGGACFTITLPLAQAGAPVEFAAPARSPGAAERFRGLPARVLLVEDEPTIMEVQMNILQSLGATPIAARSGDEAVGLLSRDEPELVVSDVLMPGLSGRELFAWVQAHRPALAGRFVFVTGDSTSEETRAFLDGTGRPYLMKPFSVEEYVHVIHDALDHGRGAA
jgi:signal transduction histidine kinase/ActR/RegA family two-component response regulator